MKIPCDQFAKTNLPSPSLPWESSCPHEAHRLTLSCYPLCHLYGSLRHPGLARFLTSSGSIPNKGGVCLKWLPSANLQTAICKKIIPSKDNWVDKSNSLPTRRHVWISPTEREPLWFFLISSCNACKPKVCDFEMAACLLNHSVCKHQHTLRDITQPWHREDIIDELVSKASRQFIYTFHCAQVYDDQNGHPEELCDMVVGICTLL